jgi:hypothetical protein
MRVDGEWLTCSDGVVRPVINGLVQITGNQWENIAFLLDAGADRTVFSADFLSLFTKTNGESLHLAGIGGNVNTIAVKTELRFTKDDGKTIAIHGTFGVFTNSESADLSVLGRDVTDNFSVIYDRPNQVVALLAPPHFYEIKTAS